MRAVFWKWFSAPNAVVRLLVGALCHGGTSESVRMLREMAVGKVGRFGVCYSLTC